MEELLIIGSGVAGLTAAVYGGRGGVSPLVVEGPMPGGALTTAPLVENLPGFADGIAGWEFVTELRRQAERFGARFRSASVKRFELRAGGGGTAELDDGERVEGRAVIVAPGARHRKLGVEGEAELTGHGVSYCATCDGAFFRGKTVAVAGGGDTALTEALFLSRLASRVHVIHRRRELRASRVLQERVAAEGKIELKLERRVLGLSSEGGRLTGLRLGGVGGAEEALAVDGLFVAVGVEPATEAFEGALAMDEGGYLKGEGQPAGVWTAGDAADARHRQAAAAAGSGCRAALEAIEYLERT